MSLRADLLKNVNEMIELSCNHESPIYMIYMIENDVALSGSDSTGSPDFGDLWFVGYFYNVDTAIECLENNRCDLSEGLCYEAAVISAVFPGLYECSTPGLRMYFKLDKLTNRYYETDEPEAMKHFAF